MPGVALLFPGFTTSFCPKAHITGQKFKINLCLLKSIYSGFCYLQQNVILTDTYVWEEGGCPAEIKIKQVHTGHFLRGICTEKDFVLNWCNSPFHKC